MDRRKFNEKLGKFVAVATVSGLSLDCQRQENVSQAVRAEIVESKIYQRVAYLVYSDGRTYRTDGDTKQIQVSQVEYVSSSGKAVYSFKFHNARSVVETHEQPLVYLVKRNESNINIPARKMVLIGNYNEVLYGVIEKITPSEAVVRFWDVNAGDEYELAFTSRFFGEAPSDGTFIEGKNLYKFMIPKYD